MASKSTVQARTNMHGYFFCLPFVAVFLIFNLWPTIYTFILGFGNMEGLKPSFDIVGLKNFDKLINA